MLNSLFKISNPAKGLTPNLKTALGLPETLGMKPDTLNFQQLMSSRLAAVNHKNGVASLSFLNPMTKQFAHFSPHGFGNSELFSIKQAVQGLKAQADKSQKPLAFQFNSKSLGRITFEIEPAENQLKIGLDEEKLEISELLVAELTSLFEKIESGPVFEFQQTGISSQLSISDAIGMIEELIEGSSKLTLNRAGQQIELDVQSVGKIAVGLKSVNGKLQARVGLPSIQTLENFKTGLLKSTVVTEDNVKFFIAKPGQETQLTQTPDKLLEIKSTIASNRQTTKVPIGIAVETIRRKVTGILQSSTPAKNLKQSLNLDIEPLGKISVEIENGKGKIGLNVGVGSQSAGNVLKRELGSLVAKPSDLNIFVRSAGKTNVSSAALLASLGTKIAPSQVVATVEKVVKSVASTAEKVTSKLQFALQTDSLGEIEVDVETSAEKPFAKLGVTSKSAKTFLTERLGRKIENLDIRVKEVGKSQQVKDFTGQFKLNSKLSGSQAIQTIREVVQSVSLNSAKLAQSEIRVQMQVENLGEMTLETNKDVEEGSVLLRTGSPQAKDFLTQTLARAGLKITEIEAGKNKGALNLKFDSLLDKNVETSSPEKTVPQPKDLTQPPALKKFTELMDVLLGPAAPVKSRLPRLSGSLLKTAGKLSRDKVAVQGKDSKQDGATLAVQDDRLKLKDDLSGTREFLGEILEKIGSDSAEFSESILNENERPVQPTLMSNNVNLDFMGGKLVSSGTVERSHLPQMLQKILEFASSQSNSAGQKLEVQLDVEKLGSLLVDAVKQKDKINLHINVDNSEVRRMLESQLRPLLDQMSKEGIEVGKLEVSVKNENADNASDWQTAQNEREFREQNVNFENPVASSAKEAMPVHMRRDFGYNSIEVLA